MTKNLRFKQAREKSGKSQDEIADLLGVSQAYISSIEKDKTFSLKNSKKFAKILNVSAEWLYFGNEEGNKGNNNTQSVEDNIHNDLAGSQIIGHNANKTGNDGYNIPGNKNVTIQKEIDPDDILSLQEFILAEQRETNRLLKKQIELLNKIIPKS
jgi:transcriptional regulator with XRE-family HTH domain